MSDTSFRVDTVPTPRLDLYGALTKDLQYYMQNKQTLPPSPRSALAAEQEKINKFMQYVNESFIIKGFSKYNPVPEQAVDSDVTAVYNDETKTFAQSFVPIARFTLQCKYVSHLYVHWTLAGDYRRADGVAEGDGRLQVQLFINNQSEGLWQQDLAPGKRSLCQALFLPNRTAGSYAVEVLARVDMGSLQVSPGGVGAAGYAKLKTTQQ